MTPDELEKRIRSEYAEAYREIKKTTKDYFDNLQDRISKQQLRLQRGEIDQNYYKQWLLNQAGRGERYKDLEKKVSDRLIDARKTATAYTNDTTPGVYTLNRNYSAYQIDMGTGPQKGTAWTAWDESTLKRLQTEDRQLVPLARTVLNINKAEKWNKQHIQSALTSAILQGKSVGQLADSFEALALMDRNSSLRNARTALTGAQNAGRQEAYREADEMGIEIKKEWICTQDSRTRDTHIELDGQIVDYDQPFETSNGHEIMYPGDPTADPSEVWNCRCTMRAILPKHKINQDRTTFIDWVNENSKKVGNSNERQEEINRKVEQELNRNTYIDITNWKANGDLFNDINEAHLNYNEPDKIILNLTEKQIIDKVGGFDPTEGSCASVAFAYLGNKMGYDVWDFAGGKSEKFFSEKANLLNISKLNGIDSKSILSLNNYVATKKLLNTIDENKQYFFTAGEHAAIIRKKDGIIEYLELQKGIGNTYYELTDEKLKKRFGVINSNDSIPDYSILISAESLCNSKEFEKLLGYVNKKG